MANSDARPHRIHRRSLSKLEFFITKRIVILRAGPTHNIITILQGRIPSLLLQGRVPSLLFCRAESHHHYSTGPSPVFTFMQGQVPSLLFCSAESRLYFSAGPSLTITILQSQVSSLLF
ncbi:hypothetical protein CDL15_Pgr013137 [Punica granatum]|uniref:Uncharacterized protein n=1 Tax=Punica granatum TaxID=22663 RepID=A0A218WE41_PUNGR|nr:hypothetical protein CDL15_Pgr013137 [Punica granatum]